MPSSHASLVVAVTTAIAIFNGLSSTAFTLALCFSVIVMYDAAGIRRHAGLQAQVRSLWQCCYKCIISFPIFSMRLSYFCAAGAQ